MADELTSAAFEGLVGETFRLEDEGGPLELRLVGLGPLGHAPPPPGRAPFSVEFAGPPDRPLPQRIYALAHDRLELPMIFLVPVGPGDDGLQRYEAVFS